MKTIYNTIAAAIVLLMLDSCADMPLTLDYAGKYGNYSVSPQAIIIVPNDSEK